MLKILAAALLVPILPTSALTVAPSASGSSPDPLLQETATPPTMVRIDGGRGNFGTDRKALQNYYDDVPAAGQYIRALDGETPMISENLPSYFLGRTEVTNEQYRAFVKDTGHRPPQHWGEEAIEIGRAAWFEDNQKRKDAGEDVQGKKFNPAKWWTDNWQDHEWLVRPEHLLLPVTFIDYDDVQAYCAWAGMRVPSEFELQFAARGKTKDMYAWGNEWEDGKYGLTSEVRGLNRTIAVGAYPAGASKSGVLDLSGNVWEWTSSPYESYKKKFKPGTYKINKKKVEAPLPKWDVTQRVSAGGSYQTDRTTARCTSRRGTEQTQITGGLGMRAAASIRIGEDISNNLLRFDIRRSLFLQEYPTVWGPSFSVAADRWAFLPGTEAPTTGRPKDYSLPDGYGVITGYEHLVFIPIEEIEEGNSETWRRTSLEKPHMIGALSITEPMLEPDLAPGTYFVLYRSKGKAPRTDPKAPAAAGGAAGGAGKAGGAAGAPQDPAPAPTKDLGYDTKKNNVIFVDSVSGEIAAVREVDGSPKFDKTKNLSGWEVEKVKEKSTDKDGKAINVEVDHLILTVEIPIVTRGKCYPFVLEFKPSVGVTAKQWRGMSRK